MPSARGVWLEAASGQILRHTPGATMNSRGRLGITTFHITNRPVSGTAISNAATPSATTMLPLRITCHQRIGRRDGICV